MSKIYFKTKNGYSSQNISNIIYCISEGCYTKIFTAEKIQSPIVICSTLLIFEKLFKDFNFFRCHRSYLVNIDFIKTFNCYKNVYNIYLIEGPVIPCSRRNVSRLKQKLNDDLNIINYCI